MPNFAKFIEDLKKDFRLKSDLKNAGIDMSIIDSAMVEFISTIMNKRGYNSSRMCAKDPNIVLYMEELHSIFPRSKFIYMVRDGRAAVFSLLTQYNSGLNQNAIRDNLYSWVNFNEKARRGCKSIGQKNCILVKYEDLILNPEKTLKEIVSFLGEKWTQELLNHQNHIGKEISVSKTEWSTHQIVIITLNLFK